MKKLIVGLLAVVLYLGLTGRAAGAELTITKNFDLVFDNLVQGAIKTVAPAGGGVGGSAQFTVTSLLGEELWIDIVVPTSMVITGPGGATMTVTLTPGAGQVGTFPLPPLGTRVVHVGGSVTAVAAQTTGLYSGTFTIDVNEVLSTATVSANVILQLIIAVNHHLAFDILVQGVTETIMPAGGGAGGSAQFMITGHAGAAISIIVPVSTVITGPAGATMTVTLNPGTTAGTQTLVGGTHAVHVGGSVTAALVQVAGAYTGTFTITAVYL